ncbi:hypothetical protein N431DRAFT_565038 [Stipitochalara longipes BDJ]|nr:hypothetical protein N431DRAFT_565038 [Stipitochalara longipes BDJ]
MDRDKSVPAIKKSRASRPKIKSGCRTCKLRGVKCDEENPVCRRCISSGRVCDGYGIWGGGGNVYGSADRAANLFSSRAPTASRIPVLSRRVSQQEKLAFDYFRIRTSIKLPGVLGSGFWETLVFQASSREPAVLHALIALGAVHLSKATEENHGSLSDTNRMSQYECLALHEYNKAIGHLDVHFRSKSKESLQVALITCMVFICIELLREKFKTANTHLNNGLKLLSEIQGRESPSPAPRSLMLRPEPGSVDDYLIEAFTRLNIHSTFFGEGSSFLYIVGQDATCGPDYEIPLVFETFREARLYLDGLMNGVYYLSVQVDEFFHTYNHVPEKFIRRKERLQASLELWLRTFDVCLASLTVQGDRRTALGIPLLRIYHLMTAIMVSVCIRPGNEMVYDLHVVDFASIVRQAVDLWKLLLQEHCIVPSSQNYDLSEPSFAIDVGFIPPLYYTALKCRVPGIRREAMNLLQAAPHREGLWDGVLAAYIARRIMEIEEGAFYEDISIRNDSDLFNSPGSIGTGDTPILPEFMRVHNVSVLLPDGASSKAELVYRRCGTEIDGSPEPKSAEINLIFSRVSSGSLSRCTLGESSSNKR